MTHRVEGISRYSQFPTIVCDQNAAVIPANAAEGWICQSKCPRIYQFLLLSFSQTGTSAILRNHYSLFGVVYNRSYYRCFIYPSLF